MRSENEARILYTIEKGFILQSKGHIRMDWEGEEC